MNPVQTSFQFIRWNIHWNSKDTIINNSNIVVYICCLLKTTKQSVNETFTKWNLWVVRPGLQTDDLLKISNSKEHIIHKSNY